MNFLAQEIKKYEEIDALVQAELAKQGIPSTVLERVIKIIDEFEDKNVDLINENRTALLIVLLAKAYNEGRIHGINEEQARRMKNN